LINLLVEKERCMPRKQNKETTTTTYRDKTQKCSQCNMKHSACSIFFEKRPQTATVTAKDSTHVAVLHHWKLSQSLLRCHLRWSAMKVCTHEIIVRRHTCSEPKEKTIRTKSETKG